MSEKNVDLQKEIVRLAYSNTELQKKVTSLQIPERFSYFISILLIYRSDPRVVSELEKKIQRLQEELTASYKRNSDNATTLLDLNAQVKDMQDEMKSKDNEYVFQIIQILTNPESNLGNPNLMELKNIFV